jgi:excisionase family DNA binding protein
MNSESQTQLDLDDMRPDPVLDHEVDRGQTRVPARTVPPTDTNLIGKATVASHRPMLLTVRDVEAELQLGRTRTYELIRSGQIPVIRLGRSVRIPREALRRWIDDHCPTVGRDQDDTPPAG